MLRVLNITSHLELRIGIALKFWLGLGRLEIRFLKIFLCQFIIGLLSMFGTGKWFFLLGISVLGGCSLFVISLDIYLDWRCFKIMVRLFSSRRSISLTISFRIHLHISFSSRNTTLAFIFLFLFLFYFYILLFLAAENYHNYNYYYHRYTNSDTNAYS